MRIAQVLDTLNWGGAQKMQLFLVENLCPLGVDITVVSLSAATDSPIPGLLQKAGARVVAFDFPHLFSPMSFLRLVGFFRRERFDMAHAYLTYSNIVAPLAGWLTGTPVLGSFRNAGYDPKRYSRKRVRVESFVLRHFARGIIANGYAVAEYGKKVVGSAVPIDVLVNAIDTSIMPALSSEQRANIRREITGDDERPIIITVGRLTPQKAHADLLTAFAQVHQAYPSAALVIAGGGSLLGSLQAQVEELGLQGHVFLLGPRDDVPNLLAAADLFVNSSTIEGTPVSVLEAMAAGLPIVATTVGDTPHLLADETGVLVPPSQPQTLADAVSDLLAAPERRRMLGQAARRRVEAEFSSAAWRRNLLSLYAKFTPLANSYLQKAGAQ